jgi:hypothetical protein
MSVIHSEILKIVHEAPGIGPGQVADMLGEDKSYVRRLMKGMAAKDAIRAEVNGNGYAFFPVNGNVNEASINRASMPIDGTFHEVDPVGYRNGSAPSFDSRLSGQGPPSSGTGLR